MKVIGHEFNRQISSNVPIPTFNNEVGLYVINWVIKISCEEIYETF